MKKLKHATDELLCVALIALGKARRTLRSELRRARYGLHVGENHLMVRLIADAQDDVRILWRATCQMKKRAGKDWTGTLTARESLAQIEREAERRRYESRLSGAEIRFPGSDYPGSMP